MAESELTQKQILGTEDDDEEFVDETLSERLWGLTEMFPESLRSVTSTATSVTWRGSKVAFSFSKSAVWIIISSFSILILPILFEKERAAMQEMQLQQQRQILLGPNAAVSGQGMPSMGMMPPPAPKAS